MEFATPQTVVNPTNLAIAQQGTYAPDANWRWMGSAAMDQAGDLVVGYSVSNSTSLYPSIAYAGRLPGDALGTLQAETTVLTGGARSPGRPSIAGVITVP